MDIIINPSALKGSIRAIPSKSQAHRLLICAAFADKPTTIHCCGTNRDIEATVDCLNALGAKITFADDKYTVYPITDQPEHAVLNCCESGSTLRFMLPIVGAMGIHATFLMAGRLPQRPMEPLISEMQRMGCMITRPDYDQICCTGKLRSGQYSIDGSISSQFITGLLFAITLIPGNSSLQITGNIESKPYIKMTQDALLQFGINTDSLTVSGGTSLQSPGELTVEGDWSNAAFFLAARALGNELTVTGLLENSSQGDRAVQDYLLQLEQNSIISSADTPDLVPILAVVAGAKSGAKFTNIQRLRLKESDRVASTASMLRALGAEVTVSQDNFTVFPGEYHGCTIDAMGDHRIAMSAAIAATVANGPITLLGAECVEKSYPEFWKEYRKAGGIYEQYIR